MKLLQTYYTSCRIGQTGSSGFQFYSFSDGITESELDEIGKLGSYGAPYGSNSFPTEEEVLNVLPIAFKYFRLSSGRAGVLQSTACTQEYTGRPGNFFTHALILAEGEFPFMPIQMYKSKYFKHDLTEEEKNVQSIPLLLPQLMADESSLNTIWNDFSIQDFIKQGNNEELLSRLTDIILTGKWKQKRIIMADNRLEDIIYVLSNALPFKNIAGLTFSTYSLYPAMQNVILSASRYEGSDFNFDDASMKFSCYVFNNTVGKYAELENQSEFSKILIRLLASEPHRINELYAYSGYFTGEKDNKSLDLIASIFSKQDFTSKWKQILPFVTDRAKPEYVERFLSEYRDRIVQLAELLQNEDEILLFFVDLTELIHRLPDISAWLKDLVLLYRSIIAKRLNSSTKSLIGLNKGILAVFKDYDHTIFREQSLFCDTYSYLIKHAHTELAVMNVFTLIVSSTKILIGALKKAGNLFSAEEMVCLVKNIDEEQISSDSFHILISETLDDTDELLSEISGIKAENLSKRFVRELANENNEIVFHEMIGKGILDNPVITDEIRKEVILQLERKALAHIPTNEELKLYTQLAKWINTTEYQAINLILASKDTPAPIEQMSAFGDRKKLSVLLEWKSFDILSSLKRSEDWENFYSLSKHITLEALNMCVGKYFKQAKDSTPLVALIIFSHSKNNRQMDELLRKILTEINHSAYNALKRSMEQYTDGVHDYFASLNKGISLKRMFNLKF